VYEQQRHAERQPLDRRGEQQAAAQLRGVRVESPSR
jgi:hypothetical protein